MRKAALALALLVGLIALTAPSPPLISVTGTVYNDAGAPAPGTPVTFNSLSTQVVGGVEVPPTSFTTVADPTGAISVSLPRGLRVNVVIGRGAPVAVTMPSQASIDLSALLGATQVPPTASVLSSLTIAGGGDYLLSATNPVGAGAATLTPGNVTRLNGNPVAALVPNPGQFLVEDAGGVSWEPFSLGGDATASASAPGRLSVNHFTLGSNAAAAGFKLTGLGAGANSGDSLAFGLNHLNDLATATAAYNMGAFKLQNLGAPGATGDALSEGNAIGALTPAAGAFTSVTTHTATGKNLDGTDNWGPANVNRVFNVEDFGADPSGAADSSPAYQAAVDAACGTDLPYGGWARNEVFLPAPLFHHAWRFNAPIFVHCSNIRLTGTFDGDHGFGTNPSTNWTVSGPAFVLAPPVATWSGLNPGPSLISGTTQSWTATTNDMHFLSLDFKDIPGFSYRGSNTLNGLAQFSVEGWVEPTDTSGGDVTGSMGTPLITGLNTGTDNIDTAYRVWVASQQVKFRLTVGGTKYTLTDTTDTLLANVKHYVMGAYDGANIRLFVDGVLRATTPATGTITQKWYEFWGLGQSFTNYTMSQEANIAFVGYTGDVRLSKIARQTCGGSVTLGTACFTSPTTASTDDANVILRLPFSPVLNQLVQGFYANGTPVWLHVGRRIGADGTSFENAGVEHVTIDHMDIGANSGSLTDAIVGAGVLSPTFEHLSFSSNQRAIKLTDLCYGVPQFKSIGTIGANGAPTGLFLNCGFVNIQDYEPDGYEVGLTMPAGSGSITNTEVAVESNYIAAFHFGPGSVIHCDNCGVDNEIFSSSAYANTILDGVRSALFTSTEFSSNFRNGNCLPAVVADGGAQLTFLDDFFDQQCATAPIVQMYTLSVTGDIAAGSADLTNLTGDNRVYNFLKPGSHVLVAGAGPSGADLYTTITRNDGVAGNQYILSVPASTTVTGAAVTVYLSPKTPVRLIDPNMPGLDTLGASTGYVFRLLTNSVEDVIMMRGAQVIGGPPAQGSVAPVQVPDPPAPLVISNGTTGATAYTYYLVGKDANGRVTNVSAAGSATDGNATLSTTNFEAIYPPINPNVVTWDILKGDTAHSLATGVKAIGGLTMDGSQALYFADTGQATSAYTAPSRNATADLIGNVVSTACAGTQALTAGAATVANPCITAASVVQCTDQTAANPVKCAPGSGSLSIAGTGADTIAWGRVK